MSKWGNAEAGTGTQPRASASRHGISAPLQSRLGTNTASTQRKGAPDGHHKSKAMVLEAAARADLANGLSQKL
jgi:hypothetical protein